MMAVYGMADPANITWSLLSCMVLRACRTPHEVCLRWIQLNV